MFRMDTAARSPDIGSLRLGFIIKTIGFKRPLFHILILIPRVDCGARFSLIYIDSAVFYYFAIFADLCAAGRAAAALESEMRVSSPRTKVLRPPAWEA